MINKITHQIYKKNLASVLGWDLISSVVENGFIIMLHQQKYLFWTVGLTY
jgi:predicted transcriptional regulator